MGSLSVQYCLCAVVFTVAAFTAACAPTPQIATLAGSTMGTTYSIKVATTTPIPEQAHATLQAKVDAKLAEINQRMSTYDPQSELSMLNRFIAGEPYAISTSLLVVLQAAEDLYLSSAGAFDPTVGPLVDIWGFGPTSPTMRRPEVPSEAVLLKARARVGWSTLRLDRQASTVLKTKADVSIDLSAIAKGYAVDQLVDLLHFEGHSNFLVEVGGEIRVSGFRNTTAKTPWLVGIEKPTVSVLPTRPHRILELKSGAIATSGDYRNAYEIDGIRYSHTLDPSTGRPVTHRGASVTVHANDCMTADALATALLVLGPERGASWAEQHDIAALFLIYNEDGSLSERRTPAMDTLLVDSSPH